MARWLGIGYGLVLVGVGLVSLLILTLFASGMNIPFTSRLYLEPALVGLGVTAGGILVVWGVLRSGTWFSRDA